ncbi:hypothetical protein COV14_04840 [Candidatus Woesearchaeota archaeon CG10_big_fil_rev_8_21_14_0_10_33_12]|nr:MAG: hypothetical protein COV14_04840 [Candidatus Woesearchaeota archaeon CG10_big_fil_rev_8_21_14_0_10_33_12]
MEAGKMKKTAIFGITAILVLLLSAGLVFAHGGSKEAGKENGNHCSMHDSMHGDSVDSEERGYMESMHEDMMGSGKMMESEMMSSRSLSSGLMSSMKEMMHDILG